MSLAIHKLRGIELPQLLKQPGMHADGGGLYLRVAKPTKSLLPTSASWVLRFMIDRKARTMGLGPFPEVTLAEARELAHDARRLKVRGDNPIALRQAERAAKRAREVQPLTFKQSAEAYIRSHQVGWKNAKHAKQWDATLTTYTYGVIGQTAVALVDNAAVLRVLQQEVEHNGRRVTLWEAKPETASRLRGRLEAVLGWASAGGLRSGDNPARWKGQLEHQLPSRSKVAQVEHHAALPHAEIGAFLQKIRALDATSARALEFTILTAGRTGEVLGARWNEIDMERALWTVPAKRMKAGREHRVPLSNRALAILETMAALREDDSDLVFPGQRPGKPLSNMVFLMLLRRMKRPDLTAHGFRSTFRDWVGEETQTPREVAEAALAHTISGKTESAYARSDLFPKRVQLMQAWDDYCSRKAKPADQK
jgi:integrase